MKNSALKKLLVSAFFISMFQTAAALDSQLYRPLNSSQGGFSVYDANENVKGQWSLGLYYNMAKHPLEFGTTNTSRQDDIVNDLHSANLVLNYNISKKISVNIDLPYHFLSDFEPIQNTSRTEEQTIGDVLVSVPIYIGKFAGLGVRVIPFAQLATGEPDFFLGQEKDIYGVHLAFEEAFQSARFLLNLGYLHREKQEVFNLRIGNSFTASLAYLQKIFGDSGLVWVNELKSEMPAGSVHQKTVNSPLEFITGLRKESQAWDWNIGFGKGLNHGYGSPDFRVIAGVSFKFPGEDLVAYEDSIVLERSSKNLPKKSVIAATPSLQAKSEQANDSEIAEKIIYIEKIYFETAKAIIQNKSYGTLNKLVSVLKENPQIQLLSIEGHTDADGSEASNYMLSHNRAKSVKSFLIKNGIEAKRLQSQGFGEKRPIASNSTAEGKFANRRVEFKVLILNSAGKLKIISK